ncbi:hypothetical protein HPB47_025670 [Ixodes persulcatus]|uniref:Uncharacterized protein n=1 Tax=Ixodes persulcatus TaxID=34615 RepID=A0AC60Q0X3_IXOPE|nr:hypothetical protein HPB47_025670 [Ixodes persulcatus]
MEALTCPSAGAWSTEDIRTLAKRELSMATMVKFVNKELAKGYVGVSWQTIKDIQAKKLYRGLLEQEQMRRRLPTPQEQELSPGEPTVTPSETLSYGKDHSGRQPKARSSTTATTAPPRNPATNTTGATAPVTPREPSTEAGSRLWAAQDTRALVLCELQAPQCMNSDEELAALLPDRSWQSVRDHRQTSTYKEALQQERQAREDKQRPPTPPTPPPKTAPIAARREDSHPDAITTTRPNVTTSIEASEPPPPAEFNLHARWTVSELKALARAELACGNEPHINLTLAKTFTTRSWQGITGQRNTKRYKDILESLKAATPSQHGRLHVHHQPLQQPFFQSAPPPLLDAQEVQTCLHRVGLTNEALIGALCTRPAGMAEVNQIFRHFGVAARQPKEQHGRRQNLHPPKNRSQRRRQQYAEHQPLYKVGPKATADRLHYNLPPIIVAGIPVPSTPINTPIRYLGIDFFINKRPVVHSHHAEDDLTIIEAASLKPFQKLRCINTLITPKYLYAASSILGSAGESAGIDKKLRVRIKTILHLPQSFPNTHLYLAARDGGLGTMNIYLFNTTIGTFHCRLASQLHVPPDLTEAEELTTALRQSRTSWWNEHRAQYANNDLFARHGQALGNTWLQPDSHHLKDGDRIKALRVRTNTYPTNAMLHHNNEAARLCRRCHQSLETPFHILQECSFIKLPRMERHNFICKQVCRLVAKYRPAATIQTEHVYQSPTGDRLKPDIIVLEGNTMTIADVAVSWDDRPASLTRMCNFKSAKYDCQRPMFPDKVVTAVGLAFGARSMLCNETVRGGGLLGLPRWDIAWLSSRALVGSLICLNRFMRK